MYSLEIMENHQILGLKGEYAKSITIPPKYCHVI